MGGTDFGRFTVYKGAYEYLQFSRDKFLSPREISDAISVGVLPISINPVRSIEQLAFFSQGHLMATLQKRLSAEGLEPLAPPPYPNGLHITMDHRGSPVLMANTFKKRKPPSKVYPGCTELTVHLETGDIEVRHNTPCWKE